MCLQSPNLFGELIHSPQAHWTIPLESKRAQALNRANVTSFFDILFNLQHQYDVPPENIYNMDEKGVQLGIGDGQQRVLVNREQKNTPVLTNGSKEMVTILETVCTDGSADIPPCFIFLQGKRSQAAWYKDNPLKAS